MIYSVPLIKEGERSQISVDLPEARGDLLHQVVRWQQASARRGTAATQTRGESGYSTRKIYPQKHTGRARHGSRSAPIFVGGGTVFGPKPRDYSYALPKKVRRLGLQMALAQRASEGRLLAVEKFAGVGGKTKEFVAWAKEQGLTGDERVLLATADPVVLQAARNLPWVITVSVEGLNVYDLMRTTWTIVDAQLWEERA